MKQWTERHRYQHTPINQESERESVLVLIVVWTLIGAMIGMAGGLAIYKARQVGERWARELIETRN